ncbi:hypothetical protein SLEP1_g51974 [Rubroshorea leprosula]|uniref:Uncharacterized protein n=1 Tax=Rubroshorea leprosula TaxID=152421 RepID=A0AAV5M4V9_9ROSI|nr:hypothetical protein SLEP1_g51974 [Rubroshorea leprosula]
MNALASGRFVQRTILTRFCNSACHEVITKLDEKDQKASVEMKKVITLVITKMKKVVIPIQGEVWVFVWEDRLTIEVETLVLKLMGQVMRKTDELAHIRAKMKDMQAIQKKGASFGSKIGVKNTNNGGDADDNCSGGDVRSNGGGGGGWGLAGMLKSLCIFNSNKKVK